MLRFVIAASVLCIVFDSRVAAADAAPANVAPPISTIATFEGEYFCIYHDRIYSVGAAICVGKLALQCSPGQFPGLKQAPAAATWVEPKSSDFCAGLTTPPVPQ
jgi:hypothetical protein